MVERVVLFDGCDADFQRLLDESIDRDEKTIDFLTLIAYGLTTTQPMTIAWRRSLTLTMA